MIVEEYEIPLERAIKRLKQLSVDRVIVQLPNGLKRLYPMIERELSRYGIDSLLTVRPTWGICDLAIPEAKSLNIGTILHIGHHTPPEMCIDNVRILFLPSTYIRNPSKLVYSTIKDLMNCGLIKAGSRIGLTCTIQHCKYLDDIIVALKTLNVIPVVSKSSREGMSLGQVLGCDYSSAISIQDKVDLFICIAGGRFHATGLAAVINKPVIGIDPYMENYFNASEGLREIIARRLHILSRAINASAFGIILCSKYGQFNLELAEAIRKKLRSVGIKVFLLVMDEVTPEYLDNITWVDAFISTACPRLAFEDLSSYRRPVLNPGEVKYIIKPDLSTYELSNSLIYSLKDFQ